MLIKRILPVLAAMLFLSLPAGCEEGQSSAASRVIGLTAPPMTSDGGGVQHQIIIQGASFTPLVVDVKTGDTVTWVNRDTTPHTVTSIRYFQDEDDISHVYIGENFDSGYIAPGDSYTRAFSDTGNFWYFSLPLHNALPIPQYLQLVQEIAVGSVVVN